PAIGFARCGSIAEQHLAKAAHAVTQRVRGIKLDGAFGKLQAFDYAVPVKVVKPFAVFAVCKPAIGIGILGKFSRRLGKMLGCSRIRFGRKLSEIPNALQHILVAGEFAGLCWVRLLSDFELDAAEQSVGNDTRHLVLESENIREGSVI